MRSDIVRRLTSCLGRLPCAAAGRRDNAELKPEPLAECVEEKCASEDGWWIVAAECGL